MSNARAILWMDHHNAHFGPLHGDGVDMVHLRSHTHPTRQHASEVRSEHEFFGRICDALGGFGEVLVTGSHLAQSDFRRYVDKHRPADAGRIVGWDTVDRPTASQLLALGRQFFHRHDRMGADPALG